MYIFTSTNPNITLMSILEKVNISHVYGIIVICEFNTGPICRPS